MRRHYSTSAVVMSNALGVLLYEACFDGLGIEAVSRLLDGGPGADIEFRRNGATPVQWAASRGHLHLVRFLDSRGADLFSTSSTFGTDALAWAAFFDKPEVCLYLISQGADPRRLDAAGRSALTHYGNRMPSPPSLAVRKSRVALLETAFAAGPHPSQVQRRREEAWQRRKNAVIAFRPLYRVQPVLADPHARLPPIDRSSPEANRQYLLNAVLGNSDLVREIVPLL